MHHIWNLTSPVFWTARKKILDSYSTNITRHEVAVKVRWAIQCPARKWGVLRIVQKPSCWEWRWTRIPWTNWINAVKCRGQIVPSLFEKISMKSITRLKNKKQFLQLNEVMIWRLRKWGVQQTIPVHIGSVSVWTRRASRYWNNTVCRNRSTRRRQSNAESQSWRTT